MEKYLNMLKENGADLAMVIDPKILLLLHGWYINVAMDAVYTEKVTGVRQTLQRGKKLRK